MNILIINGPNINMLGIRETSVYGSATYQDLLDLVQEHGQRQDLRVHCFQSNHEGALVDQIQAALGKYDGIIINPAAYTHTSIALLDALKAVNIPTVEVHISEVSAREDFRQLSYVRQACVATISGHGLRGYTEAMDLLIEHIQR